MGTLALVGHLFGGFVEPGLQARADRCLRASGSGCRECVDICPAGALRLGPSGSTEAPQSVLSQCTDCGLCAAACPSGAITGVGVPAGALTREAERQSAAMSVVCAPARRERPSSEQDQSFSVSCLAALHPETVVATALALRPGSTLTLARGECSGCPGPQQVRAEEVGRKAIELLTRLDDGGRAIVIHSSSPGSPDALMGSPARPGRPAPRGWSRRELFTAIRPGERARRTPGVTPARAALLSQSVDPAAVAAQLPHPVNAQGCTFCTACVAVCPTQALRIERRLSDDADPDDLGERLALSVDPGRCVGCGRCAQVCVEDLLTLGVGTGASSDKPQHGGGPVVLVEGKRSSCDTCLQPLAPAERGVCRRCDSASSLVADVLAR